MEHKYHSKKIGFIHILVLPTTFEKPRNNFVSRYNFGPYCNHHICSYSSRAGRAFLQALHVTRSFISSSRSAFRGAFKKKNFRVPRFAFPHSCVPNVVKRSSFACLKKKIRVQHQAEGDIKLIPPHTHTPGDEMTASGTRAAQSGQGGRGGGLTRGTTQKKILTKSFSLTRPKREDGLIYSSILCFDESHVTPPPHPLHLQYGLALCYGNQLVGCASSDI